MSREAVRARRLRREREREIARQLRQRMDTQLFVLANGDEVAINVPDVGAIFLSRVEDILVIEAVAHSGPGVEVRKAQLEEICRIAGFGDAVDEGLRRRAVAS
jgi:hypothetical protein